MKYDFTAALMEDLYEDSRIIESIEQYKLISTPVNYRFVSPGKAFEKMPVNVFDSVVDAEQQLKIANLLSDDYLWKTSRWNGKNKQNIYVHELEGRSYGFKPATDGRIFQYELIKEPDKLEIDQNKGVINTFGSWEQASTELDLPNLETSPLETVYDRRTERNLEFNTAEINGDLYGFVLRQDNITFGEFRGFDKYGSLIRDENKPTIIDFLDATDPHLYDADFLDTGVFSKKMYNEQFILNCPQCGISHAVINKSWYTFMQRNKYDLTKGCLCTACKNQTAKDAERFGSGIINRNLWAGLQLDDPSLARNKYPEDYKLLSGDLWLSGVNSKGEQNTKLLFELNRYNSQVKVKDEEQFAKAYNINFLKPTSSLILKWNCDNGLTSHRPTYLPAKLAFTREYVCDDCQAKAGKAISVGELFVLGLLKKLAKINSILGNIEHTYIIPNAGKRNLDVYISGLRIGIEYDGMKYHQNIERDQAKDELCTNAGIQLIRLREPGCPRYNTNDDKIQFVELTNVIDNLHLTKQAKNVELIIDAIEKMAGQKLDTSYLNSDYITDLKLFITNERQTNNLALANATAFWERTSDWSPVTAGKVANRIIQHKNSFSHAYINGEHYDNITAKVIQSALDTTNELHIIRVNKDQHKSYWLITRWTKELVSQNI